MKAFKNQKQLFNWIWDNREHVSELTGKPLLPPGHFQWHWQFVHLLGKGPYPGYRLNPDNVILALPEEHEQQESFPFFIEKRDELKRQYYDEFYTVPKF